MSASDLEVVRRLYAAWLSGDLLRAGELLDPDIELHLAPEGQQYWPDLDPVLHGPIGFATYLARINEVFDDYRSQIEEIIDLGPHVLTLAVESGRGKHSGAPVEERQTAHLWTVRGDHAVSLRLFWDRDQLAAAGVELP